MRCLVCKSPLIIFKYKIGVFRYFTCTNCGCLQLDKLKFDKFDYLDFDYKTGFRNEQRIRLRAKLIIKDITKIKRNILSVLDVGCGAGFMLDEFRNYSDCLVGSGVSVFG